VLNLCVKLIMLLCNNTNSLLVVALDCRCIVKLKVNTSKEIHLLFYLRGSKRE
jgi:hypothetical protein